MHSFFAKLLPDQSQTPSNPFSRGLHPYLSLAEYKQRAGRRQYFRQRINPSRGRYHTKVGWWCASYDHVDGSTLQEWSERTGLAGDDLRAFLHTIRDDAWQLFPDYSVGRWWFLKSVMANNPFYDEVKSLAQTGATVIDLACGLGQELRQIRNDGATGWLYAVDKSGEMWKLGILLFQDISLSWASFVELDVMENGSMYNGFPSDTALPEVYLLNDFLSFLDPAMILYSLREIGHASTIGAKVIGWAVGQEGDDAYGTGARGVIHNPRTFRAAWDDSGFAANVRWEVRTCLLDFEQLGFSSADCDWFAGTFFRDCRAGISFELKALCFLATRTM